MRFGSFYHRTKRNKKSSQGSRHINSFFTMIVIQNHFKLKINLLFSFFLKQIIVACLMHKIRLFLSYNGLRNNFVLYNLQSYFFIFQVRKKVMFIKQEKNVRKKVLWKEVINSSSLILQAFFADFCNICDFNELLLYFFGIESFFPKIL